MLRGIELQCDACSANVTHTDKVADHRLALTSEQRPNYPGHVAESFVANAPAIQRTHHFCDIACLGRWTAAQHRLQTMTMYGSAATV